MPEVKLPRLLAAAKEFNIGQDTLIEFLNSKGFSRDDLKPTVKLSEDMYKALQQEFQSDKVAKTKADQIEIPKIAQPERKKKDEEEIVFKRDEVKIPPPVEIKVQDLPKVPSAETIAEEIPSNPMPEQAEAEIIKIEAPQIEVPKVIQKIDLESIDSSTRPRKSREPVEIIKPVIEPKKEETIQEQEEVKMAEATTEVEENTNSEEIEETQEVNTNMVSTAPVVENIKADRIGGLTIVGTIKLPVDNDTRPKSEPRDEKRKRKRIPVDKKVSDVTNRGDRPDDGGFRGGDRRPNTNAPGTQRPGPGQGGGGGGRFNRTDQKPGDRRSAPGQGGYKGGGRDNRRPQTITDKEIDQKEIQEKIRETQAKLAGSSGRGKSLKAKYRREKRQGVADTPGAPEDNKLQVTEFVTVSELANLMDVSFTDVISKCMSLGIMVSINQRLDAEVIELVSGEFGYEVEFIGVDDVEEEMDDEEEDKPEDLVPRAPIVTIMGHVDHGKTSLLDYIRSANVVAGEAGGITQHIGAYEVTLQNGRHITFLDTPGHEAFTAMRARGAKVTDIAVIVVAADDAVMPQTREAISHAQAAGVPMIFAINKIDKDGANSTKIYEQLSQMNILVESWGGKFQSQEISAKKGLNVELLLEKILLEADLLELTANPSRESSGTIIEASLDKGRGYVATVLVQNGTLSLGDLMVSGQHYGRIKAMFNERNQRTDVAPPSTPVQILGLNGAPQPGEKFKVFEDEGEAKDVANKRAQILREQGLRARKHITLDEIGRRLALGNFKELKLIIKGDVDGSVEALSDSLQKLTTPEIGVSVVHKAVGQISESDVLLATASDAIILGFNVRPSLQANRLAENEGVEIKLYSIIYNAIEEIKSAMEGLLEPKIEERIVANVEVREVYKFDKATVAGCQVIEGKINRNHKVRIIRDGIVEFPKGEGASAELGSLKRYKDDIKEVPSGMECGLTIKNYHDLKVGDIIEAYEQEEIKRTL